MSNVYIFPVLMVFIVMILLCLYMHARRQWASRGAVPAQADRPSSICVINLSVTQEEGDRHTNRLPPRYSTVDHPPPYALFDPKLRSPQPRGPPPDYGMYPINLPLAPHLSSPQCLTDRLNDTAILRVL